MAIQSAKIGWYVTESDGAKKRRFLPSRGLSCYRYRMRPLWPIEREILEITAADYPTSTAALRQQINTAHVISFENTGAGFFSELVVAANTPLLTAESPLSGAHGNVLGIEHGMGFIVFLEDGRVSLIEGYCNGDTSTSEIDFSRAAYRLMSWDLPLELRGSTG